MRKETLPPLNEIMQAMEAAANDLYGFGMICFGGVSWTAEPEILDTLFLAMENFWFTEGSNSKISHQEFREEFFKSLWERSKGKIAAPNVGLDVPLGHEEMAFYKMPQVSRAVIYLRTKKHFSVSSIGLILGLDHGVVREEIEKTREFLLGRSVKSLEWSEDEF